MNLIDNLTCKYCNKIYTEPVFLNCCGQNICKEDILLFKSSTGIFTCPICNTAVKRGKFQINQTLQVLIDEAELHKLKLDPGYLKTLNEFKEKLANIESIHKDPLNVIYDKISELKMDVDLDREKAKAEIDTLADDMIAKLNYLEAEFKAESSSKEILSYYDNLIGFMKKELNEYEKHLKSLSYTDEERKKKRNDVTDAIAILGMETNEFKNKLFKNKSLAYEPMQPAIWSLYGTLIVSTYLLYKRLS